jgi:hypothetical protein
MTADSSARKAAAKPIGIAKRVTVRTPMRLIAANATTIAIASGVIGMKGTYQACSAVADRIAVKPHVGIQPHQ